MRKKAIWMNYFILAGVCSVWAQNIFQKTEKHLDSLLYTPASDFGIKTLSGKKYTLASLQGQVVVLNFWFAACGPCVKEIPLLNEVAEKYKDKNVHFLALSNRDNKEFLLQWLQRRTFNYILVPSAEEVAKLYNIRVYPVNMVIDKEGIIRFAKVGYDKEIKDILDQEIQKLLAE